MSNAPWGYHLILDCGKCDMNAITNRDVIADFTKTLVNQIGMKAFGEPQIVRFGEEEHLKGYTLVQLIHTSCVTAHFCDASGDAYLDIFSCKEFDVEIAKNVVKAFFKPDTMTELYLTRQA